MGRCSLRNEDFQHKSNAKTKTDTYQTTARIIVLQIINMKRMSLLFNFLVQKAIRVGKVLFKGKGNSLRGCSVSLLSIRAVCLGQPRQH